MDSYANDSFVDSIQCEIQKATKDLEHVDENLRKLTGRDFLEPRNEKRPRVNSVNQEEPTTIRKPSVLSRLGGKVSNFGGRKVQEVIEDEVVDANHTKPSLASSIVARPQPDGKSRTEVVAALNQDKASAARNRRMFGSLLGTLQRFRKDEAKQQFRDDRRAMIIQRVEEKSKAEKEKMWQERKELLGERKEKQARIRRLHRKMEDMKRYEAWESYRRSLGRFIRTKAKPQIFWMPKTSHSRSTQLVSATKEAIEGELKEKRKELTDELNDLLGKRKSKNKPSEETDGDTSNDEENRTVSAKKPADSDDSQSDFNDASDLLDYEEGELLYEDALMLPGKKGKKLEKGEKMVVQVNRMESEVSQRRVEVVNVEKESKVKKRVREESGSGRENENAQMRRVTVTYRNGIDKDKGKKAVKEEKKHKHKKKKKGEEKSISSVERPSVRKKEKILKKKINVRSSSRSTSSDSSSEEERQKKPLKKRIQPSIISLSDKENNMKSSTQKKIESQVLQQTVASTNEGSQDPSPPATPPSPSEILDEALADPVGELQLPHEDNETNADKEPPVNPSAQSLTPNFTEIVVQHVSLTSQNGQLDKPTNNDAMEVQTLYINPNSIKKEKEDAGYAEAVETTESVTVKKEKDPTPLSNPVPCKSEQTSKSSDDKQTETGVKDTQKSYKLPSKRKKDSSDSDSDSSQSGAGDNTAARKKKLSSDSQSSSESVEEQKKKTKKLKTKPTRVIRKKRRDSSTESSGSSSGSSGRKSRSDKKKKRRRRSSSSSSSSSASSRGRRRRSVDSSSTSSSSDNETARKTKNKKKVEKETRKKSPQPLTKSSRNQKIHERQREKKGKDRRSRSRSRRRSSERAARKSRR